MFGYIVMNKPEIKFKDFDLYRSFYCGLCRELKSKYGISGQISLTYDMTFVVILLSALYEPPTQKGSTRCIIHPVCKQPVRRNTVTEYAADMNVLLTYYKCRDDWEDEKKVTALGYSKVLQGKVKKLDQKYPDKSRRIQKLLSELSEMEKSGEKDIDKMAGCFGISSQPSCRSCNCLHFCMSSHIRQSLCQIMGTRNNAVATYHYRPNGNFTPIRGFPGFL